MVASRGRVDRLERCAVDNKLMYLFGILEYYGRCLQPTYYGGLWSMFIARR